MRRPVLCVLVSAALAAGAARGDLIPNDPLYPGSWHHGEIDSPEAWAVSTGSPAVRVAILDSGLYAAHADLTGRVLAGYNVLDGSTDTSPSTDHGTAMAGIAAAGVNNGLGVAGLGNFGLVPVKVTAGSMAFSANIVAGINWVAANASALNIRVLVLGHYLPPASAGYAAALANLRAQGVLAVGSMRNDAAVVAADTANMVLVGGTDHTGALAATSDHGPALDIVAPSVDIHTTYYDPTGVNTWEYAVALSGNSWAAPQVAGAAALAWAINPNLTPQEVEQLLYNTAADLGAPGRDDLYGWGMLDVGALSAAALATVPEPATLGLLGLGSAGLALLRRRR